MWHLDRNCIHCTHQGTAVVVPAFGRCILCGTKPCPGLPTVICARCDAPLYTTEPLCNPSTDARKGLPHVVALTRFMDPGSPHWHVSGFENCPGSPYSWNTVKPYIQKSRVELKLRELISKLRIALDAKKSALCGNQRDSWTTGTSAGLGQVHVIRSRSVPRLSESRQLEAGSTRRRRPRESPSDAHHA